MELWALTFVAGCACVIVGTLRRHVQSSGRSHLLRAHAAWGRAPGPGRTP